MENTPEKSTKKETNSTLTKLAFPQIIWPWKTFSL